MSRRGKKKGRPVSGWLVLDKPVGMGSTEAVSKIKWLFQAEKAGHAGTLDPLASGMLPIALGEATKTVPYVMDGAKVYRFTVAWGEERSTDDLEGPATKTSDLRPSEEAIRALLPKYTGVIQQTPPQFSAIKIAGERAYDLAREGETVDIPSREVEIGRLDLVEMRAECHRVRGRVRQGHLCALARPRHGPRPRLLRPHRRTAPQRRRAVHAPTTSCTLAELEAALAAAAAPTTPRTALGRRRRARAASRARRAPARHRRRARLPAAGGRRATTPRPRSGSAIRSSCAAATRRWRPTRPAPPRAAS